MEKTFLLHEKETTTTESARFKSGIVQKVLDANLLGNIPQSRGLYREVAI